MQFLAVVQGVIEHFTCWRGANSGWANPTPLCVQPSPSAKSIPILGPSTRIQVGERAVGRRTGRRSDACLAAAQAGTGTVPLTAVPLTAAQLTAVEAKDGVCLDDGFYHLFKFLNRGVTQIEWIGNGKGNGLILVHYGDGSPMVPTEIPGASELATHGIPVSLPASEPYVYVMVNCTGGQLCTDAITDDGG